MATRPKKSNQKNNYTLVKSLAFIVHKLCWHLPHRVRNSVQQTATTFDCMRNNTKLTYTMTRDPVLLLIQSKVVAVCWAEFRTLCGTWHIHVFYIEIIILSDHFWETHRRHSLVYLRNDRKVSSCFTKYSWCSSHAVQTKILQTV